MILVCFAMEDEARPFRSWALTHSEVAVMLSGVGSANAERNLRRWLSRHGLPDSLLTCGFAGGLDPKWKTGDVLYEADLAFPQFAKLEFAGARPGRFHQAPRILATAAEKAACFAATHCDAVEMESQTLRAACRAEGIPSATLRVISDPAGVDMPLDFNQFMTPKQTMAYGRLLGHLATHPRVLPRLLAFHRETLIAARKMAEALAAICG